MRLKVVCQPKPGSQEAAPGSPAQVLPSEAWAKTDGQPLTLWLP